MLCHAGGSALETVMYSLDRPAVLTLSLVLVAMISLPAQERPAPQKFATGTERPIVSFDAFAGADPSASAARGQATEPSDRPLSLPLPRASTVILVDDNQLSRQQAARLRPAFKGLIDSGEHRRPRRRSRRDRRLPPRRASEFSHRR